MVLPEADLSIRLVRNVEPAPDVVIALRLCLLDLRLWVICLLCLKQEVVFEPDKPRLFLLRFFFLIFFFNLLPLLPRQIADHRF